MLERALKEGSDRAANCREVSGKWERPTLYRVIESVRNKEQE